MFMVKTDMHIKAGFPAVLQQQTFQKLLYQWVGLEMWTATGH